MRFRFQPKRQIAAITSRGIRAIGVNHKFEELTHLTPLKQSLEWLIEPCERQSELCYYLLRSQGDRATLVQ